MSPFRAVMATQVDGIGGPPTCGEFALPERPDRGGICRAVYEDEGGMVGEVIGERG